MTINSLAPARAQNNYFHFAGNLHSHSQYSDGNMAGNPAYLRALPCYQYAEQSDYVDFWGISDHNHSSGGMYLPNFHKGLREADSVNQPGNFVTCYGAEYGVISSGGHVLIYGVDSLIGWEPGNYDIYNAESDYNNLFRKIAQRPNAFALLAHMSQNDYDNLLSQPYNAIWDAAICGMAIKSGPAFSTDTLYNDPSSGTYFPRFKDMLAKGYHLAPQIDHDNHYINFGRSHQGRTIVLADTLSRESIYAAIKERRFYATDDINARVDFTVNNVVMGSIIDGGDNPVIRIKLNDPDNEGIYEIRLYYGVSGNGLQPVVIAAVQGTDSLVYTHITAAGQQNYYFAEILQTDYQRLYSAPVWYTRNNDPSAVTLLNFTGELQQRFAKLKWSTSSEQDADYFDVLKSSGTLPYTSIGTIQASGTTTTLSTYTFDDPQMLMTPAAYQLKIFSFNGSYSYSQPVVLRPFEMQSELTIFPNPATDQNVWALLKSDSLQHLELEIINSAGQRMDRTELFTAGNETLLPLDLSLYQAGLYLVRITNMDSRKSITARLIRNK